MAAIVYDYRQDELNPRPPAQQVLVMYHGTSVDNAISILRDDFIISTGQNQMLGNGIYVSRTMEKAQRYGEVIFRMLVYPGRVAKITYQRHPMQRTWQENFSSAWVPPNCGMVRSGLEETCVKGPSQIRILGICQGWDELPDYAQELVRDCSQKQNLASLSRREHKTLEEFLDDLCLSYSKVRCSHGWISDKRYASGVPHFVSDDEEEEEDDDDDEDECGEEEEQEEEEEDDGDDMYWTTSWDNLLENKKTGRVLMMKQDRQLVMSRFVEDGHNFRYQKWKVDTWNETLTSRYFRERV